MGEEEQVFNADEVYGSGPMEDREIIPGGPLVSQVQSWKKQFGVYDKADRLIHEGEVFLTRVANAVFVWRWLGRAEYKQIMALPNLDPLQREEAICETCVLWPPGYNYETMAVGPAGVPAMLAQQIMIASGFDEMIQPMQL